MPRLKNSLTGVVIDIADEIAGSYGPPWTPADEKAPAKKAPAKSTEK